MADTESRHAKRRGRRRGRAGLRVGLGLVVVAVLGPLVYLALSGAQVALPNWVTERIETRLNAGLGEGRVTLDRASVALARNGVPRVQFGNVGVYDARGAEIARLNQVGAALSRGRLFDGAVNPSVLRLSGAQITVLRNRDGTFDLKLGGGVGASGTLAGVLDELDAAFTRAPLAELKRVEADQLTITLEDSRSGRVWQVTDGEITLSHDAERLDVTVSADVFNGTEELASAVIGFRTQKGTPQATLTATFENAAAADIAAQAPALAFLEVLDAPIAGAISTNIGPDGQIERLAGSLEIGSGALQPTRGTKPIRFDAGRAYVTYAPETRTIDFTEISFRTAAARATASGRAYLQDFRAGWPETLVGQLSVSDVVVQPANMLAEPAEFRAGATDFRLRLNPFTLEVGQLSLQAGERRYLADGRITAAREGWGVALDVTLDAIPLDRLLALWPVEMVPGTRRWVTRNVETGVIRNMTGIWRQTPGGPPELSLSYSFRDAELRFLDGFPPIAAASGYATLAEHAYTTVIETGRIEAPSGGMLDMAGSVFRVRDVRPKPARAEVTLGIDGPIPAVLSLLDLEPLRLMSRAGRSPDIAEGRARVSAELAFDLRRGLKPKDLAFAVDGDLSGVSSDVLVRGRRLAAERLRLSAAPDHVTISGNARLGQVPVDATWTQDLGPEADGDSRVEGTVELSQAFLDEFGIRLPPGTLRGAGVGQVTVALPRDAPPRFTLISDLNRLGLALDAVGWRKSRNATGRLEVVGRLGADPAIERLAIDAGGLSATGSVTLAEGGQLETARFDRLRVGGWLDAPLTLTGRGPGRPPAIAFSGGTLDLRNAAFGGGGGGGGPGGPVTAEFDRLVVSSGIALTAFRGQFTTGVGLDGRFQALVNGASAISGQLVPTREGTAIRLQSGEAGGVLASAGILKNMRGGTLDMTLVPTGARGVYDGSLGIEDTRIVEAPALTELLSAISIVGLIDRMNSGGITLTDVSAEFRLTPDRVTLYRSSAVGPSLGLSLDGIYDLAADRVDMQGVVSPVYFLNGIGQLFTRPGEGLFGFNFRLVGSGAAPQVQVNPLSIMTPGMFREIFRRAPPERTQ